MSQARQSGDKLPGVNWRSKDEVKELSKELYQEVQQDKVTSLAAAFAYHTVFAIPALLILTLSIAALVESVSSVNVTENLREVIQERAPAETKDLLNSIVDNAIARISGGGASLSVLLTAALALWSGSNAINALIEAFNQAYGVKESRPFVRKKLVVLGLTVLVALMVNLALALLVFGERIGSWIADKAGLGSAFDVIWGITRWPLGIAAIAVILALLYYAGPNIDQSFRWISPGSILATVLWLIATLGFGIYLQFSNPGSAYGVLGSVLVLMFFLYVTGIVFLLGAELNALIGRKYDPEVARDMANRPDVDPEKRRDAQEQLSRANSQA